MDPRQLRMFQRLSFKLGIVALLLLSPCALAPNDAHAQGSGVQITGVRLVPIEDVRTAIGTFPSDPRDIVPWAHGALKRIVVLYKSRDYKFARAWFRVTGDKRSVEFEVD